MLRHSALRASCVWVKMLSFFLLLLADYSFKEWEEPKKKNPSVVARSATSVLQNDIVTHADGQSRVVLALMF